MISKKAYTEAYIALESLDLLGDLPSSLVEEMKKVRVVFQSCLE